MRSEQEIRSRLESVDIAVRRAQAALIDGVDHPLFPRNGEFLGSMTALLSSIARKRGFLEALQWVCGAEDAMTNPHMANQEMAEGFTAVADLMKKHLRLAQEKDREGRASDGG